MRPFFSSSFCTENSPELELELDEDQETEFDRASSDYYDVSDQFLADCEAYFTRVRS